jgi:small-conductance mechanosensitive channel
MGTIERIGLKTTRLRSISGEQLVIANSDLLESRIQNFKRMGERRVLFKFGVVYGTPMEKLETVPGIIRAAVEAEPKVRFDRSHLASFDQMQVTFESVYYVLSSDFRTYMDVQQKVLLTLYQRLGAEGIRFALPGGNAADPVQPLRN